MRRPLPKKRANEGGKFTIGLIYGWDGPDWIEANILRKWSTVDCVAEGHHHNPSQIDRGGTLLFKPGSFGVEIWEGDERTRKRLKSINRIKKWNCFFFNIL